MIIPIIKIIGTITMIIALISSAKQLYKDIEYKTCEDVWEDGEKTTANIVAGIIAIILLIITSFAIWI